LRLFAGESSGKQLLKIADFRLQRKEDRTMSTHTAVTAPTQFVEANGIRFAYRRWGKRSGLPLVFNHHLNGNLDNWDPAVLDGPECQADRVSRRQPRFVVRESRGLCFRDNPISEQRVVEACEAQSNSNAQQLR
jgi:hypothetical protein